MLDYIARQYDVKEVHITQVMRGTSHGSGQAIG